MLVDGLSTQTRVTKTFNHELAPLDVSNARPQLIATAFCFGADPKGVGDGLLSPYGSERSRASCQKA